MSPGWTKKEPSPGRQVKESMQRELPGRAAPVQTWHIWEVRPGDQVHYAGTISSKPPWEDPDIYYLTPEQHEKVMGSDRTHIEEVI